MDMIRHCYVTEMRLVKDDPRTWKVRWIWAEKNAPWIKGHSPFRANAQWDGSYKANWDLKKVPENKTVTKELWSPPKLGEQLWMEDTTYDRGIDPNRACAHPFCGDPNVLAVGAIVEEPPAADPSCPKPITNVVASWEVRGHGRVVCFGGPAFFAPDPSLPRNTPVDNMPNLDWWARFDHWLATFPTRWSGLGASVGSSYDWLVNSEFRPVLSNVGNADNDYSTDESVAEFWATLKNVRVLWMGYANQSVTSPQLLSDALYPWLIEWMRLGGIVLCVGNAEPVDASTPRCNANLVGLNCEQSFVHGDVGPVVQKFDRDPYGFTWTDPAPAHQQWFADSGQSPPLPKQWHNITPASGTYPQAVGWIWEPYFDPLAVHYWEIEATFTVTIARDHLKTYDRFEVYYQLGFQRLFATIPGNTPEADTTYTFAVPAGCVFNYGGIWLCYIYFRAFSPAGLQTMRVRNIDCTFHKCTPAGQCSPLGLRQNDCSPQLRAEKGYPVPCPPRTMRVCTTTGGLPLVWYDNEYIPQCTHGLLGLVGSTRQRGPTLERAAGLLGLVGSTRQHHAESQHARGLLGLVGSTRQGIPARQTSAGLLGLVGSTRQTVSRRQTSAGLLGLVGSTRQTVSRRQTFQGTIGMFGITVQRHVELQTSAGLLGLVGSTQQQGRQPQRPAGLLGLVGSTRQHLGYWQRPAGLLGLVGSTRQTVPALVYLLDHFTGANGTNLTAHAMDTGSGWTAQTGAITIQGNAARASVSSVRYTANAGHTDVLASAVHVPQTGSIAALMARMSAGGNGYGIYCQGGSAIRLARFTGGSPTTLGAAGPTATVGVSVTVAVRCVGNTISGYVNGVQFATVTDLTYPSNTLAGLLGLGGTTYTWDDFTVVPG